LRRAYEINKRCFGDDHPATQSIAEELRELEMPANKEVPT